MMSSILKFILTNRLTTRLTTQRIIVKILSKILRNSIQLNWVMKITEDLWQTTGFIVMLFRPLTNYFLMLITQKTGYGPRKSTTSLMSSMKKSNS